MSATVKTCQLLIHTSFLKKIKNEEGKRRRKKLHMAFLHDRHIKLQTGLKSLKWLLEDLTSSLIKSNFGSSCKFNYG